MAMMFGSQETIHAVAYSYLNETLGLEDYEAFLHEPATAARFDNLVSYVGSDPVGIGKSLATFSAFAEGVSLYSAFAVLYSFQMRNLLKGIGQQMKWSVRDESLHSKMGCQLFRHMCSQIPGLKEECKEHVYDAALTMHNAEMTYISKLFEMGDIEGITEYDLKHFIKKRTGDKIKELGYKAEGKFIGPTLEKEGLSDKNIIVWDHNRDLISERANMIFEDEEAAKYAWGIGFHWYETWTGGLPKYDNLKNIKESFPSKNMMFTEGCQEGFDTERLHYWPNAERYGNSMINDFNSGVVGWTDWNILLDERGGPNHVQNFCFAPIHADTKTGQLIYTPTYYYIGHFSKFISPGAKRVSTTTSRTTLESTSFLNKDGSLITVVMNKTDQSIRYKLAIGEVETTVIIQPHAMQTLVY